MTIEQTQISNATPVITGQLATILFAIQALRQDSKVPPLNQLKAGQLYRRIADCLRGRGFENREIPSRSTFDRFRRQFGPAFGIR
jgi:hypothetical protein